MRCPHCAQRIGGGIPNSIPESQTRTIEERVIALTDDVARDHFIAEGKREEIAFVVSRLRAEASRAQNIRASALLVSLASEFEGHIKAGDAPTGDER